MATTAEYKLGEHTFPRGWFMVAASEEVTMKPMAARYFGQDVVLYRGESGTPYMVGAYCPHMGTHLAKNSTSYTVLDGNQVEGESIKCPYHAWSFGPDGKCDNIPYSPQKIPKAACIPSWTVKEQAGVIFAWHDEEGGEPDFDLPPMVEWDDPEFVNWKIDHLGELPCHPIEIIDNMTDKAHLGPIHGSTDMELFENEFDGHTIRQILAAGHRTLAEGVMTNNTWYTGPGILLSRMIGDQPSLMLICHTPVEDGTLKAWHALFVKTDDVPTAREYQEASRLALMQDFEVWANKRPCFNIMQVEGDGPFHKTRIWYKQFYNPRAKVKEIQERSNGKIITKGTKRDPWPEAELA